MLNYFQSVYYVYVPVIQWGLLSLIEILVKYIIHYHWNIHHLCLKYNNNNNNNNNSNSNNALSLLLYPLFVPYSLSLSLLILSSFPPSHPLIFLPPFLSFSPLLLSSPPLSPPLPSLSLTFKWSYFIQPNMSQPKPNERWRLHVHLSYNSPVQHLRK